MSKVHSPLVLTLALTFLAAPIVGQDAHLSITGLRPGRVGTGLVQGKVLQSFNTVGATPNVLGLGEGIKAVGFSLNQATVLTGVDIRVAASSGAQEQTLRAFIYMGTPAKGPVGVPLAQGLATVPRLRTPLVNTPWTSVRFSRMRFRKGTYLYVAFETSTEQRSRLLYAWPNGVLVTPLPTFLKTSKSKTWQSQRTMNLPVRLPTATQAQSPAPSPS